MRTSCLAFALLTHVLAGAASWAAGYRMVDLPVPEDGTPGIALSINDAGCIVGSVRSLADPYTYLPVLWPSASQTPVALAARGTPRTINSSGTVAGTITGTPGNLSAFIWSADSGITELGRFRGQSTYVEAMNDAGQIVGCYARGFIGTAYAWTPGSGVEPLPGFGGEGSVAHDINDAGDIVGSATTADNVTQACIWERDGGIVSIGSLGGNWSTASVINDAGMVVGMSEISETELGMFTWGRLNGMVEVARFRYDDVWVELHGINDYGVVVGEFSYFSAHDVDYEGFVWDAENGFTSLGAAIPRDINNAGQIVGYRRGEDWYSGGTPVIWQPVPEPSSLRLLVTALALPAVVVAVKRHRK